MASSVPPVKNAAFTFDIALISQADTDIFKTSPTLAAGDILVSKDGGNFANITTLPTQIQSTGVLPVALTAAEMNGDRITVLFHDAAGSEWQDAVVTIYTAAQTLDTTDAAVDAVKADTTAILEDTGTTLDNLVDDLETRLTATRAGYLDNLATAPATAAGVWAYGTRTLTQSAAAVTAVVTGSDITITRGDTTSISLTDLGAITGYTQVWFAVKEAPDSQADTASLIYVTQTGGLVYLNGAAVALPYLSSDASIVVDDAATGDITITLKAALTAALTARGGYQYEVQWKSAAGAIATLTQGTFNVSADVVRAVS